MATPGGPEDLDVIDGEEPEPGESSLGNRGEEGTEPWPVETRRPRYLARVEEKLREDPCPFEFFQAVRLLERISGFRKPVGQFSNPEQEAVRFKVHNALPFPASQIFKIDWPEAKPPEMMVNFFGLTGPSGVLPYSYTELIAERMRGRDHTLASFFDLFNHRLLSLFYQAWEKYRFPVAYERDRNDRFTQILRSLIGIGTPGLQSRQPVPDEALLFYTGILSMLPRSAVALRDVLMDYFGVPVEVEQFVGAWYPLDENDQCCFDSGRPYSEDLGIGAVAGDEIWDQQARARIVLGPLTLEQYRQFLPTGSAYPALKALTRFFSDEHEFEAQLILKQNEVPACDLSLEGDDGLQLGWVTWMKSKREFPRNPGDTVLLLK